MNILLRILALFLVTSLTSCVVALGNDSACCDEKKAGASCEEVEQEVMDMQCCLDAAALGQECAKCTDK